MTHGPIDFICGNWHTEVIRNETPITTIKDSRVAAVFTLQTLVQQLQKMQPFVPTYMFYNHSRPPDYPLWSKELVHVASQFLGQMITVNALQLDSHSYRQTHIWQNTFPNGHLRETVPNDRWISKI